LPNRSAFEKRNDSRVILSSSRKRGQLFIRTHNETFSVAVMRVNDPDRSPFKIQHLGNSPSFITDSALMRLASSCSVRLVLTLKGASKCQNT
jgi:hypothetical protein